MAQSEPGRQALVCGTPYQLMGAVAPLLEGATCQPETCDLYPRHGFANAAAISRGLRDEHLARTVVDVAPGKGASLGLRGSEASVAMDESARAQATGGHVPDAPYARILCSYPYDTVKALLRASPDAELVLFDDGLGSYEGDILRDNGGSGLPRPAALYVSAPELCHSSASDIIRKPPFSLGDRRLVDTLQRIFAVDYAQLAPYHGKRCVYLTQPVDAHAERAEMDRRVLGLLDPHAREVIVRPHPRDPRIVYDENGLPWGLARKSGIAGEGSVARGTCRSAGRAAVAKRRLCQAAVPMRSVWAFSAMKTKFVGQPKDRTRHVSTPLAHIADSSFGKRQVASLPPQVPSRAQAQPHVQTRVESPIAPQDGSFPFPQTAFSWQQTLKSIASKAYASSCKPGAVQQRALLRLLARPLTPAQQHAPLRLFALPANQNRPPAGIRWAEM